MANFKQGVIVIRHGEGTHNVGNFYSGDPFQPGYVEANLTEKGRHQVVAAGKRLMLEGLTSSHIVRIVSSPLPRTVESSRILMEELSVSEEVMATDDRAIEASLGQREGQLMSQFDDKDKWFPDNPQTFGGEGREQIRSRIVSLYNELVADHRGKEGIVLLVSHGAPLCLLIEAITGQEERLPTAGYKMLPMRTVSV